MPTIEGESPGWWWQDWTSGEFDLTFSDDDGLYKEVVIHKSHENRRVVYLQVTKVQHLN